ncbi:hypothetical protein TSOC_006592 [Tetrabaena socialis]|uniref:Glutaredoxin-like protein n=1 Tax=Tetrabaena socialis TaxID=47790 RepID=A0A2J8A386_9CHLO|nr:hypothetical protein TSOC_006592 [Tetrabaena socialis]|eukprot:PNH06980.1 hypothetical protein TSOC_006592 [Tetrabaena socialis]
MLTLRSPSMSHGALKGRGPGAWSLPRRRLPLVAVACSEPGKVLILYSKPNCPLCEGTRDRVQGLIERAAFMPSALTEYTLEVRDISTNAAWSAAYDMEVPVLTTITPAGEEVRIPRSPPRMTTDKLRQHIEASLPK